jgi:hypothetical protein
MLSYCNGVDQRIARQRLRKHGPTRKNRTTGLCNQFLGNGSIKPSREQAAMETVFSVGYATTSC